MNYILGWLLPGEILGSILISSAVYLQIIFTRSCFREESQMVSFIHCELLKKIFFSIEKSIISRFMFLIFSKLYLLGLEIHITFGALQFSDKHHGFLKRVLRRMALVLTKIGKSEREFFWEREMIVEHWVRVLWACRERVNVIGKLSCCMWEELPWKLSPKLPSYLYLLVSKVTKILTTSHLYGWCWCSFSHLIRSQPFAFYNVGICNSILVAFQHWHLFPQSYI